MNITSIFDKWYVTVIISFVTIPLILGPLMYLYIIPLEKEDFSKAEKEITTINTCTELIVFNSDFSHKYGLYQEHVVKVREDITHRMEELKCP